MKRHTLPLAAIALSLGLSAAPVAAQSTDSPYSVGVQSSWPSYGVSLRYQLSEKMQVQGVVGALGEVTNFSGRLNYDIKDEAKYDIYGYGSVGLWRYSFNFLGISESETSIGVGGGAGFEFDLQEVFDPDNDDFPPLYWSIEMGLTMASFDAYNWSAFSLGGGLHYRF